MKKTIFLTGGTGFIGSSIAANLINTGAHLELLARSKGGKSAEERVHGVFRQILPDTIIPARSYNIVQGDITNENLSIDSPTFSRLKNRIDEVWHCAAFLKNFDEAHAKDNQKINVDGTKNLLDFAMKVGASRFHYISTAYVCGDKTGKIKETFTDGGQKFRNPYEKSKFDAEQLVRKYGSDYSLSYTIYRPSVVIGHSQTGVTTSFEGYYFLARWFYLLKRMISREIKSYPEKYARAGIVLKNDKLQLPIRIPCPDNQTVNLINIDYIVNTILDIASSEKSAGNVFHLTNPHPPTCDFLFRESLSVLGIEGCKFVSLAEFYSSAIEKSLVTDIEDDFIKGCKTYLPYIFSEAEFDVSNVRKILDKKYIEPPLITREILESILSYAINKRFKSGE